MLILWTSTSGQELKKAIGPTVSGWGPPPHKVVVDSQTTLPPASPGDVVLAMGSKAIKALADAKVVPKNRTISSLRGTGIEHKGVKYFVTFDAGIMNIDYGMWVNLKLDTALACRTAVTGKEEPDVGDYRYVDDYTEAVYLLEKMIDEEGKKPVISVDLETLTLDPYNPETFIVSISLTYREGMADVIRFQGHDDQPKKGSLLHDQINWLLNSPNIRLRGANYKYDAVWIREKWGLLSTAFKMDTTLVGSLLDENRSNSLNTHAKVYTSMGGYDDCVAPETLVCTDDLRWVPIGDVKSGDGLLGFDEEITTQGERRRMRRARAVSTKRLTKSGVEVEFSNGVTIRCSDDHGFLAHRYKNNGPFQWVRAYELKPGVRAMSVIDPREPLHTWEAGYLSGLYDGEGYLSSGGMGLVSGLSQAPGLVWKKYCKGMANIGLSGFYSRQKNSDGVHTSKHSGAPTLQMLQLLRPVRLLNKYGYEGKCIPSGTEKVYVESVTPIGPIEVVSLETDCHTFVAEGIASHNSFNKKYDKGRMDLVPDEPLLLYAGGDTDATLRVSNAQLKELAKDPKLKRFYQTILHPASVAFEAMEREGVLVDVDHYMKLQTELEKELKFLNDRAMKMLPRRLQLKYKDNLSLTRSRILTDFLFSPRGLNLKPLEYTAKAPKDNPGHEHASTAMDHLKQFIDHQDAGPFIQALSNYSKAKKTLGTYVTGFMSHLRADGRLHPTAILYKGAYGDSDDSGTLTGRLAFKDPAFQTVPKHTNWAQELRRGYIAPPGYIVVNWDYSQGELRITACVANEPNMLDSYRQGIDLHLRTGAQLNGIDITDALAMKKSDDEEQQKLIKKIRQGGKAGNFGLIYGMSAAGYQAYAFATYGVVLTLEEAEKQRDAFFALYAGLPDWHVNFKKFAHHHGHIRSPLGRVRHLPLINARDNATRSKAERQSINSPIQATLSDMSCWALAEFHQNYGEPDGCRFFAMTHDALTAYVKEDEFDYWVPLVREIMENLPFEKVGWNPQLHFDVDYEYGPNMGDMQEAA